MPVSDYAKDVLVEAQWLEQHLNDEEIRIIEPVPGIAGAQEPPVGAQDDRGQRDPDADRWDVHRERQRLHLARLQQVGLLDGDKRESRQHGESVFPVCAPIGGDAVDHSHRQ